MDLEHRPRRLRRTPALRRLARETRLCAAELIAPLFIEAGSRIKTPLPTLPGQFRWSADTVGEEAKRLEGLGVGGVILFGIPATKDATGSSGSDPKGPVPLALRAIELAAPRLVRMADVCLCEYTDTGHCGVLAGHVPGGHVPGGHVPGGHVPGVSDVDNDATLPLLAREAVVYAQAGADVVAPSAMMDGQVAAIRAELDGAGFTYTPILAYSAKTASAFYGPFRDAAGSTPGKGDRKGYQMDPSNRAEALEEARLDVAEGADAVMVKPALPNLDLIRDIANEVSVPVAAYQVSGEYASLHAAAERGLMDLDRAVFETLTGIRRAGARWILTYFAGYAAQALAEGRWDRG